METKTLMRNPYLVLAYCLFFVFLSSFILKVSPAMYIVIFILTAIITLLVRPLTEAYLKPTCYFLLGSLSYWMVARDLVVNPGGPEPALFILFGLALVNALVALITYSDGHMGGQAFVAGALSLLFLNIPSHYTFLSGVLVFVASSVLAYFIFMIKERSQIPENVSKAAIVSSLFLYASALSHFWNGVSLGVYKVPSTFVFGFSIIYLIAISAFTVWCTLWIFEFFLARFGYVRALDGERAVYRKIGEQKAPVPEKIEKAQAKKRK